MAADRCDRCGRKVRALTGLIDEMRELMPVVWVCDRCRKKLEVLKGWRKVTR